MSKGFHMIGWRLGWVCGHERIVRAFADIKDNSDSGQFIAIQKAACSGPRRSDDPAAGAAEISTAGCEKLVAALGAAALRAECRAARISSIRRARKEWRAGERFETAEAASQYLITEHSICTVPWDDAGAFYGSRSPTKRPTKAAEDALMAETEARMKQMQPQF